MGTPLTAEDLLAGGAVTHTVPLPTSLLRPGGNGGSSPNPVVRGDVVLRPLLIRDVERVVRAAKEQRVLTSVLMVQQALVAPKLTVDQVGNLPAGVVQFLAEQVSTISGLSLGEEDLERAVKAPLTKACFVLAQEFGWTPSECAALTVGQVLLYLEMLARDERPEGEG
jgi:hypothetical protein